MANEHQIDDRLAALIAAYGSDATRWPEAERGRAGELPAAGALHVGLYREARALDQVLHTARDAANDAADRQSASDDLMDRILSRLPATVASAASSAAPLSDPTSSQAGASVVERGDAQNAHSTQTGTVVPFARPQPGASADDLATVHRNQGTVPATAGSFPRKQWPAAAALMAASLVLGLYLGTTTQFESTVRGVGDFAGVNLTSTVQTSALDEALMLNDDEDIL